MLVLPYRSRLSMSDGGRLIWLVAGFASGAGAVWARRRGGRLGFLLLLIGALLFAVGAIDLKLPTKLSEALPESCSPKLFGAFLHPAAKSASPSRLASTPSPHHR